MISAQITATCIALDPIHHGAGALGNTSIMRMEDRIDPKTGARVRVPFISGASMRHMIREAGVLFALEAMGVEDSFADDVLKGLPEDHPSRATVEKLAKSDSLMRALVVLLLSGGQMTSTGAAVKLDVARRLEWLFPVLSLMGYSAGNRMTESRLKMQNMYLACEETAHMLRDDVRAYGAAALPARATLTETFGTRRDASEGATAQRLIAEREAGADTTEIAKGDPVQMIWDVQCVQAGSVWQWGMMLNNVREMELAAFQAAIERACLGQHSDGGLIFFVGAKSAQGFGRMSIHFDGALRRSVQAPEFDKTAIIPNHATGNQLRDAYVAHLKEHKADIIGAIAEVVK